VRFRFDKLKLKELEWKKLREDTSLKFYIGLAVVLILFFAFFVDIVYSIYKYRYYVEKQPKPIVNIIEKKQVQKQPQKKEEKKKEIKQKKIFARIAIILDDAGSNIPDYRSIYSIKQPLTLSVIPHLPTSQKVAEEAKNEGLEIMMHLPMEPNNGALVKKYTGMVMVSDTDGVIKNIVLEDFASVKIAKGFNNHMGSKATQDERVMRAVFSALKEIKTPVFGSKIFFVDSKTSSSSIAYSIAKELNIPSNENDIFLDGDTNGNMIEARLGQLLEKARRKGYAIGIGHATRKETIAVLKKHMPELAKNGVKFVHASELVK
jgi:uncharacterized protein